jgi:hypothetical protein
LSIRLLKIQPRIAKVLIVTFVLLCAVAAFFFARWHFANAVASRIDPKLAESKLIIDSLVALAPSDPQTHYAAATVFEKTFESGDLERSLREYETAAALSPHSYQMWVNLGRARNLAGDTPGADAAFKRALELAPNYAAVQWAYGNFLIREGRSDEGFKLAAFSARTNADFARSAVTIALQIYDGNVAEVERILGEGEAVNAALASSLTALERYEEAVAAWSRLERSAKLTTQKPFGEKLIEKLAAAKKFRLAAVVTSDLAEDEAGKVTIGAISNGGFETGIKQRGAKLFEWQIQEGKEPQIGLSDTQKRSGKFGLFMVFNSFEAAEFRTISQTVAVEPGRTYEFEGFYRSDLKSASALKIEIADAVTGGAVTATPALALAGDWATLRLKFVVPQTSDGVIIRLSRDTCAGSACRITGRLSFDDLSLKQL